MTGYGPANLVDITAAMLKAPWLESEFHTGQTALLEQLEKRASGPLGLFLGRGIGLLGDLVNQPLLPRDDMSQKVPIEADIPLGAASEFGCITGLEQPTARIARRPPPYGPAEYEATLVDEVAAEVQGVDKRLGTAIAPITRTAKGSHVNNGHGAPSDFGECFPS